MAQKLAIIGAGGCAREVFEIALEINGVAPTWDIQGFVVIGNYPAPDRLRDYPVFRGLDAITARSDLHLVIAIGNSVHRHRLASLLTVGPVQWARLVHPRAWIGRHVEIGYGSVICAGTSITTDVRMGQHVHVNQNCAIGHDAILDDCVSLNPGTCVSGGVHLEKGVECGAGVTIIPNVSVGAWSILGAGAVVTTDLPSNITAVGAPARVIKTRPSG